MDGHVFMNFFFSIFYLKLLTDVVNEYKEQLENRN